MKNKIIIAFTLGLGIGLCLSFGHAAEGDDVPNGFKPMLKKLVRTVEHMDKNTDKLVDLMSKVEEHLKHIEERK